MPHVAADWVRSPSILRTTLVGCCSRNDPTMMPTSIHKKAARTTFAISQTCACLWAELGAWGGLCGMVKEVHEHKREVVATSDQPHVPWVR